MIRVVRTDEPNRLAWAVSMLWWKRIYTGRQFYRILHADQRAAILAHEAGHCDYHHFELSLLLLPFLPDRAWYWINRKMELAADRYAAKRGHAAALCELFKRPFEPDPHYPSPAERRAALAPFIERIADQEYIVDDRRKPDKRR